jgi:hypothetical protein
LRDSAITVVSWRQVRPNRLEDFLNAARRQMQRQRQHVVLARVFQSRQEPDVVLTVIDRPDLAAYRARETSLRAELDALCEGPPERRGYSPIYQSGSPSARVPAAVLTFFWAPVEGVGRLFTHLQETGPLVDSLPGCTFRVLYQGLDGAPHYFALSGLDSPTRFEPFAEATAGYLRPSVLGFGVTVERYEALTRVEILPTS